MSASQPYLLLPLPDLTLLLHSLLLSPSSCPPLLNLVVLLSSAAQGRSGRWCCGGACPRRGGARADPPPGPPASPGRKTSARLLGRRPCRGGALPHRRVGCRSRRGGERARRADSLTGAGEHDALAHGPPASLGWSSSLPAHGLLASPGRSLSSPAGGLLGLMGRSSSSPGRLARRRQSFCSTSTNREK